MTEISEIDTLLLPLVTLTISPKVIIDMLFFFQVTNIAAKLTCCQTRRRKVKPNRAVWLHFVMSILATGLDLLFDAVLDPRNQFLVSFEAVPLNALFLPCFPFSKFGQDSKLYQNIFMDIKY